jgi:outer membrane protein
MKTVIQRSLLAAFILASVPAFALRVAYIDIKKAFDGYEGTKEAKEKLKKQAEGEKSKIEGEQDKLSKQLEELQSQKAALSPAKYAERKKAIETDVDTLKSQVQVVQNDLAGQEQKMTEDILEEIREVVAKVADREKYDYVFEKSTLMYGGIEITASVINELNAKK